MSEFSYSAIIERILSKNRWGSEGALAERLGISANTWTAYKQAKRSFGLHEVAKICDELGVTPRWLLFGEEGEASSTLRTKIRALLVLVGDANEIRFPPVTLDNEAARLEQELLAQIIDPDDPEELGMRLKLLQKSLMKDSKEAVAAPGTGKRSA